jgi:hypothetical protein
MTESTDQLQFAPVKGCAGKDSAVVGFDFAPKGFGDFTGDAFIAREGDFGFTVANGIPKEEPDIVRVEFLRPAGTRLSIFVQNVNPQTSARWMRNSAPMAPSTSSTSARSAMLE